MSRARLARMGRILRTELPAYAAATRSPRNGAFAIFAQGRTGTWLLHDLLNQQPGIDCDKEILERRVLAPLPFVAGRRAASRGRVYGCHIQPDQLITTQRLDPVAFIRDLDRRGWRIVHVRRRDLVRQSVSAILAVQRRTWVVRDPSRAPDGPTAIDIDRVIERIRRRRAHLAIEAEALSGIAHLPLIYEDDLATVDAQSRSVARICDLVGLPPAPATAGTLRLIPERLDSAVVNHAELMDRVAHAFPDLAATGDAA